MLISTMHSLTEMYPAFFSDLDQSVDSYEAMYAQLHTTPLAAPSLSDVTSPIRAPTPDTPTTSELDLEDILDDPEYDQISDRKEVIESEACWRGDPIVIRRRAMAEDFSEGKLETLVDSPQKENAGTQTQYVSYQITTKVCMHVCSSMSAVKLTSAA
jgi:hypothetical protein